MLTQTHLPIMETENFKSVYGSLKFSIQEQKLSVVLGAPGSGKTTVLKMLESENPTRNHYILCSPNTTMKSMLLAIADAINVDVKGDNDRIQTQITTALQDNPNHCIIFDECEVSAKYSCGFPDPQVLPIIVVDRYLDYFTTIMEDRLWQVLAEPVSRWRNRSGLSMNAARAA